jgi:hypothetical protein
MRARSLGFLLIAFLSVLTVTVGCGDDDGTAGPGAPGASDGAGNNSGRSQATNGDSEFIATANDVCEKRMKQIRKKVNFLLRGDTRKSPQALAATIVNGAVRPGLKQQIREIRALNIPTNESSNVEAIIKATEKTVAKAGSNPLAFVRNERPFARSEKLANESGLISCGRL